MRAEVATLCFLVLSFTSSSGNQQNRTVPSNASDLQRLVAYLRSQNPDKVRPVRDYKDTVTVQVAFGARRINLDDDKQEMAVDAWSFMSWKDEYLRWTPSEYGGLESVSLWSSDVWLPDLTVYNRVGGTNTPLFVEVTVIVSSKGEVIWFPETHVKVPCEMNLKRWPSDRHNCSINLGAWAHDATQITVEKSPGQDEMMVEDYSASTDWRLVNHSTWRRLVEMSGTKHSDLRLSFVMERVAADKASYIVSSSFVVVVCLLASYFIPVTKLTARLSLHLFAISVFIGGDLVLFLSLPTNGGTLPHVVRYYTGSLFLSTLSLLTSLGLYGMTLRSPGLLEQITRLAHSRKIVGTYSHLSNSEPDTAAPASSQRANILETHIGIDGPASQTTADQGGGSLGAPREEGSRGAESSSTTETRLGLLHAAQERRHSQIMTMVKMVNFVAGVIFAVAFLVDYLVLRSYM